MSTRSVLQGVWLYQLQYLGSEWFGQELKQADLARIERQPQFAHISGIDAILDGNRYLVSTSPTPMLCFLLDSQAFKTIYPESHGPYGESEYSIRLGILISPTKVTSRTVPGENSALAAPTKVFGPRGLPKPRVVRGEPELYLQNSGEFGDAEANNSEVRILIIFGFCEAYL
ncbi:MAG: hypothetical protein KF851_19600 [Pirellulaceae bacterium]|nr:hypothetical protein [Pirellulaceae bacterium]